MTTPWPTSEEALIAAQHDLALARPEPWLLHRGAPAVAGCFVCYRHGRVGPEDREGGITGGPEQPERLERAERHDQADEDRDPGIPQDEDEDDRRDEDRRTDGPITEHGSGRPSVCGCQRPKRRLRPANSSSAASKASGPKSGQSALEV